MAAGKKDAVVVLEGKLMELQSVHIATLHELGRCKALVRKMMDKKTENGEREIK